jgi:hypothetical protein
MQFSENIGCQDTYFFRKKGNFSAKILAKTCFKPKTTDYANAKCDIIICKLFGNMIKILIFAPELSMLIINSL